MKRSTDYYFECHVTIEPVFDEQLEKIKAVAESKGFKVASLLMKKRAVDTEERSQYDTFMTAHSKDFSQLRNQMIDLIALLKHMQIKVWRYKIEDILIDSRYSDVEELL